MGCIASPQVVFYRASSAAEQLSSILNLSNGPNTLLLTAMATSWARLTIRQASQSCPTLAVIAQMSAMCKSRPSSIAKTPSEPAWKAEAPPSPERDLEWDGDAPVAGIILI